VTRWLEAVRASGNSAPTLIICQRCHGNGYVLETTADSLTVQQCQECNSEGSVMFSMHYNPDNM
jgi:DnaJ-class molecular chaperone